MPEPAHKRQLISTVYATPLMTPVHTRAQMRAAENAANSHILEPADVDNDSNSSLLVLTQL